MFAFIAAALTSGQQYKVRQTPSKLLLQKKFILELIICNSAQMIQRKQLHSCIILSHSDL